MEEIKLKEFLDKKVSEYNQPSFIDHDPVSVPHRFTRKQDIEIAGFFAAIFSWGNRKTIINKSLELMQLMDNAPHDFVLNHTSHDLVKMYGFCHRTFTATDLLYFIEFFQFYYRSSDSLEMAFFGKNPYQKDEDLVEKGLNSFREYFFSLEDVPFRTRKHIASPIRKSTCKRLNMFLRWMVRNDTRGVDFGIWKSISPAQLICPVDLHVARVAKRFNMLERKAVDWEAALEITRYLRILDPEDPVKYDFALFGLGITERF